MSGRAARQFTYARVTIPLKRLVKAQAAKTNLIPSEQTNNFRRLWLSVNSESQIIVKPPRYVPLLDRVSGTGGRMALKKRYDRFRIALLPA